MDISDIEIDIDNFPIVRRVDDDKRYSERWVVMLTPSMDDRLRRFCYERKTKGSTLMRELVGQVLDHHDATRDGGAS